MGERGAHQRAPQPTRAASRLKQQRPPRLQASLQLAPTLHTSSPDAHRLRTRPSSEQVTPLHWHGGRLESQPRRPADAANASQLSMDCRNASRAAAAGGQCSGSQGVRRQGLPLRCRENTAAGSLNPPPATPRLTVAVLAGNAHVLRSSHQRYPLQWPQHRCGLRRGWDARVWHSHCEGGGGGARLGRCSAAAGFVVAALSSAPCTLRCTFSTT